MVFVLFLSLSGLYAVPKTLVGGLFVCFFVC